MRCENIDDNGMKRKIIEAGKFLFELKGFDGTSIHDLTAALGIDEDTFIVYFRSLDELLEVIWSE